MIVVVPTVDVLPHQFRMLIDGRLVDGAQRLEVINPASGRLLANCGRADPGQSEEAISAASSAFAEWTDRSTADRRDLLLQVADALAGRSGEFTTLVPDSLYEEMCSALTALAQRMVVGDCMDTATEMGPLQNRAQFERVKALLADSAAHARVIAGGKPLDRAGYFIAPTIVRDIADDSSLVREEQFGPVLPVLRYSDLRDAIRRANDTEYGLGASVWSQDLERAEAVAMKLASGSVWINKSSELLPDVPLSGAKQSGLGFELGDAGLEEYTQSKVVNVSK